MKITFQRSGGFAGLIQSATFDTASDSAELPANKAQELERLVEGARPFDQPAEKQGARQVYDGYQYDLTIKEGGRTHKMQVSQGAVPARLEPLIRWLSNEMDESLRKKIRARDKTGK